MRILVLNGSPRGKYSTTVHTLQYLEKRYPDQEFRYLNVGTKIRALEKDMSEAVEAVNWAEALIFSYPVYTFLAPSQLHRFLSALKTSGADLEGKYATQVTTSKHFYDVTAHRYVEDNCHDLGLKVVHGLSADMEDLTTPQGRKDAEDFFEYFLWCVAHNVYESASDAPAETPSYVSGLTPVPKKEGKDTVIVADLRPGDQALAAMIQDFEAVYPYKTRLVNLAEYPFSGGCLGCFHCAGDGTCIHKDGFDRFLRKPFRPRTPWSTPLRFGITPWALPSKSMTTASSATATEPSPRECPLPIL